MAKSTSELTFRAVVSGLFVGCLISASNVTIGLKIGWTFGASITAAVISYALFRGVLNPKRPYTDKENLISATAGSSAGTMASAGGFVAAIPALEMIRASKGLEPLSLGALMIWAISIAFLGVHFAVPLRKQMVVVEKLRYPTGTAAAETIKAMYASGVEAMKKTKVLLWAAIFAALVKFLFLFDDLGLPFELGLGAWEDISFDDFGLYGVAFLAMPLHQLLLGVNMSPMMLGAGVLIGPKVGWSLLGGSIVAWGIIVPILFNNGIVEVAPNLGNLRSSIAHVENGESNKSEKALERSIADVIKRSERLAKNRENISAAEILFEYSEANLVTSLKSRVDDIIYASRNSGEVPSTIDFSTSIAAHENAFKLMMDRLGDTQNLTQKFDLWARKAIETVPVAHMQYLVESEMLRESMAAQKGGEKDFNALILPYTSISNKLAAGDSLSSWNGVSSLASMLAIKAGEQMKAGEAIGSIEDLNTLADKHKYKLAYDLPDTTSPYRAGFNWVLWAGVAVMITSSFTSLALQYKVIAKTFSSLSSAAKGEKGEDDDDAPDPYPMKYWVVGMILASTLTATLAYIHFGIPVWEGLLAIVISLLIAAIAVRATGETDINPVGAMGKITQVVYGAIAPGKMQINLMAAAISSAGASQAGDLMHDLKAGYLLKVSVRRQVITQLIGVIVGVFAAAGTFRVLNMVYEIPGREFPGPAVYAWYKMAEILAVGLDALPNGALYGAAVGAALGIILPLMGKFAPKVNRYLPSTVAFGIAFMVPAVYSIGMWLGAVLTTFATKKNPERVEKYGFSLASGFIAGEGLMMVAFAIFLMLTQVIFA